MKQSLKFNEALKLFSNKVVIPPGLEDLVEDYARSIKTDLIILRESIEHTNFDKIENIIHKLKGTAESYGFSVVDSTLNMIKNFLQEIRNEDALILCDKLIQYVEDFLCEQDV